MWGETGLSRVGLQGKRSKVSIHVKLMQRETLGMRFDMHSWMISTPPKLLQLYQSH